MYFVLSARAAAALLYGRCWALLLLHCRKEEERLATKNGILDGISDIILGRIGVYFVASARTAAALLYCRCWALLLLLP